MFSAFIRLCRYRLVCSFLAFLISSLLLISPSSASNEYPLKAAFIFNLMRMVEWPQEQTQTAEQPLNLCVLGNNSFGDAFEAIRDKQVRGHPIRVAFYAYPPAQTQLACHVLFIDRSETAHLTELLRLLQAYPVLTVSDIEAFAERGGMVNLATGDDQRVRLEINRQVAQQAGVNISARLLALAKLVDTLE